MRSIGVRGLRSRFVSDCISARPRSGTGTISYCRSTRRPGAWRSRRRPVCADGGGPTSGSDHGNRSWCAQVARYRNSGAPVPARPTVVPAPVERRRRIVSLPSPRTSFVGRDESVATVRRLLAAEQLVTLTGVGGCGKTRLAIEVAHQEVPAHPDGVWFVDLAAIADDGASRAWPRLRSSSRSTIGLR